MIAIKRTVETEIKFTNDKPAEYAELCEAVALVASTFGMNAELTRRGYDYDLKITLSEESK